jgi:hypothetical protein
MVKLPRLLAPLLGALALQASATTLDFETLTRGAVITTQLLAQGVLVSGTDNSGCCQPGRVINTSVGDLGVYNFGGSGQQALVYGIAGDQLNFDFVLPNTSIATSWDSVSLRVGDGDSVPEKFRVTFKGLTGDVLDVQEYITTSGPVNGGATASFSGGGVHRVEVLGLVYASGGGVDDLSFSSAVPEPASWASLAAGLLLIGTRLRRRARSA